MGLLQRACETYDANRELAGVYREGHEVLPPVGHILTAADIEIMINAEGSFIQATAVPKDAPKTLIPATEASMGRTSAPCAHPLCDTLAYIGTQDNEKHTLYTEALEKWRSSAFGHPFLDAVSEYVRHGSMIDDLEKASLITNVNGRPSNEKLLIRWRVTGVPGEEEACWQNTRLHDQFARYMLSQA